MSEVGIQERSGNPVEGAKPKERHSVRIAETATERKTRTMPLDSSINMSERGMSISGTSTTPRSASLKGMTPREKDRKIGHRRVDEAGQVTYKKRPTSELMNAIQLGIGQSVGSLSSKPERDLLLQDFVVVENVVFPSEGSNLTPAHHCSDFRFKTYAPIAFRYFRELFGIQPDDFLLSMCNDPLRELSNPGASGSIFYITNDDEFIIKTVQHKEAEFLQKLLPGYYMNLNQNPRTLLPKFYGLYCYQCGGKNIRMIAMNNLLPSSIVMHEKYDLKGSTYKRKASKRERAKAHPTLKDLDFTENHPEGIYLEADTYSALIKTLERDCRVLQSFKIMDYSLLMGVHNLDQTQKAKMQGENGEGSSTPGGVGGVDPGGQTPARPGHRPGHPHHAHRTPLQTQLSRGRSQKQRIANYSTALESIQAKAEPVDMEEDVPPGGIPARNSRGERLLLYLGIIDILQSYRLKKKLEHAMKAMVHDGDTISVHRPGFYAQRFQSFFAQSVFKKIPSPLKHSPSKKKGPMTRMKSISVSEAEPSSREVGERPRAQTQIEEAAGAVGGRPDLLPDHNIPAVSLDQLPGGEEGAPGRPHVTPHTDTRLHSDTRVQTDTSRSYTTTRTSGGDQYSLSSPVPSISESTPTHTEYTEDSGIASEQIELHVVTSERTVKRTLLPPGSPARHPDKHEEVVREDLASPSSSGSPTTRATSGETSYASIVNSQTTLASSSADDYVSPEEEMR